MAVNNSLTKTQSQQRLGLTAFLTKDAIRNNIAQVVGGKDSQKFIASVVSAVQTNPQLQDCSNSSILSAALLGASLNLTPSPQLGQYYMVPFNNTKAGIKEAQFQLGYKGYIQLAIRSGYYKKLNVLAIKEGELVRFDPMNEDIEVNLIEDEDLRMNTPTVGYYAFFEYTNGFRKAIYWSKKRMESHALKYSQGYRAKKGFTFWEKDFDAMAYKTMLRQLISKWGIMSVDMQTAIENDMAVIKDDGSKMYVDNDLIGIEEAPKIEAPAPEETKKAEKKTEKAAPEASAPADAASALFG